MNSSQRKEKGRQAKHQARRANSLEKKVDNLTNDYLRGNISLEQIKNLSQENYQIYILFIKNMKRLLANGTIIDEGKVRDYDDLIAAVNGSLDIDAASSEIVGIVSPLLEVIGDSESKETIKKLLPIIFPALEETAYALLIQNPSQTDILSRLVTPEVANDMSYVYLSKIFSNFISLMNAPSSSAEKKTELAGRATENHREAEKGNFRYIGQAIKRALDTESDLPPEFYRTDGVFKEILSGTPYPNFGKLFEDIRNNKIPKLCVQHFLDMMQHFKTNNSETVSSTAMIRSILMQSPSALGGINYTLAELDSKIPEQSRILNELVDDYIKPVQQTAWDTSGQEHFGQNFSQERWPENSVMEVVQKQITPAFQAVYESFRRRSSHELPNLTEETNSLTIGIGYQNSEGHTVVYLAFTARNKDKKAFLSDLAAELSRATQITVQALFINAKEQLLRTNIQQRIFDKICDNPSEVDKNIKIHYLSKLIETSFIPFVDQNTQLSIAKTFSNTLKNSKRQQLKNNLLENLHQFNADCDNSENFIATQIKKYCQVVISLLDNNKITEPLKSFFWDSIKAEFGRCCVEEVLSLRVGNKLTKALSLKRHSSGTFKAYLIDPCIHKCRLFAGAYQMLHEFSQVRTIHDYNKLAEEKGKPQLEGWTVDGEAFMQQLNDFCQIIKGTTQKDVLQHSDPEYQLESAVTKKDFKELISSILLGCDVNKSGKGGWTPLHLATSREYIEGVIILLLAGADISLTTDKKETALSIAQDRMWDFGVTLLNLYLSESPKVVQVDELPECIEAIYDCGYRLYQNNNYDFAFNAFSKVIELEPNHLLANKFKGLSLIALERHQEARDFYTKSLNNSNLKEIFTEFNLGLGEIEKKLETVEDEVESPTP